ncbi:MAG: ATP-binding cassette domain-containing protein [Chloroflexi bacterium]|nr:ATP-binding cassette domain-containing protein [Chloroflexota bacterium]MCY4112411.1 ATP-binding cassette domain-containing protein [Chloroflexota bacterium]
MIVLEDVHKVYPNGTQALNGVSLEIPERDFAFLVGPSGAGKTTIIRLINRDETVTTGSVFVEATDVTRLRRRDVPQLRRRVGVIYQDYKLLPSLTVRQNVEFVLKATNEFDHLSDGLVEETLATVGLTRRTNHYPHQLSGGEQQRTAIARALVRRCPILVADEPTGNLDQESGWETIQLLVQLNARGTTVVIATHNRTLVDTMRRRVIEIERGRVVRDEPEGGYYG